MVIFRVFNRRCTRFFVASHVSGQGPCYEERFFLLFLGSSFKFGVKVFKRYGPGNASFTCLEFNSSFPARLVCGHLASERSRSIAIFVALRARGAVRGALRFVHQGAQANVTGVGPGSVLKELVSSASATLYNGFSYVECGVKRGLDGSIAVHVGRAQERPKLYCGLCEQIETCLRARRLFRVVRWRISVSVEVGGLRYANLGLQRVGGVVGRLW